MFYGSLISMTLDGLAFLSSAWNAAIPHLIYLKNEYLILKRQLQYCAFPVTPPCPHPLGGIASLCVFSCIARQIFVLFSTSMRLYSWESQILIMLNMINIHSFFVSIASSKCEVHSRFMINVYCPVPGFCALDCVLHPSNSITYYYSYDIRAIQ